jgi:hypothetical protein
LPRGNAGAHAAFAKWQFKLISLVIATVAPLWSQPLFEKSYAIVIGIDAYRSPSWHTLVYAVSDAGAMAT